jgi:hypothetical protein
MKRELRILNRLIWSVVFFAGVIIFIWMEWNSSPTGAMFWFFKTSMWSMVCAIGFSIFEWILHTLES